MAKYLRSDGVEGEGEIVQYSGRLVHSVKWPDQKWPVRYTDMQLRKCKIETAHLIADIPTDGVSVPVDVVLDGVLQQAEVIVPEDVALSPEFQEAMEDGPWNLDEPEEPGVIAAPPKADEVTEPPADWNQLVYDEPKVESAPVVEPAPVVELASLPVDAQPVEGVYRPEIEAEQPPKIERLSEAELIRRHLAKNPQASNQDVVEALGGYGVVVTKSQVSKERNRK